MSTVEEYNAEEKGNIEDQPAKNVKKVPGPFNFDQVGIMKDMGSRVLYS